MQRLFAKWAGSGAAMLLTGFLSVGLALAPAGRAAADDGPPSLRMPQFQPFSGRIVVARQPGGPNTPWRTLATLNVQPVLDGFMDAYRPQAEQMLKAELGKGGRWDGQTAYDLDVRLAKRGQLYARNLSMDFQYVLRGNSVGFHITTPGPLPKAFDPAFVIDFDLEVTLYTSLDSMQIKSVEARVQNAHIRGDNVTGSLATAVSDLSGFLGGPDFRKSLEGRIDAQKQMASLNVGLKNLGSAIPAGLDVRPFLDADGRTLTLAIQEPPAVPVRIH